MKVVSNTHDEALGSEMKSFDKNYVLQKFTFKKSLLFREIYVKYLEKNSILA